VEPGLAAVGRDRGQALPSSVELAQHTLENLSTASGGGGSGAERIASSAKRAPATNADNS
jgi:hypothetical protein